MNKGEPGLSWRFFINQDSWLFCGKVKLCHAVESGKSMVTHYWSRTSLMGIVRGDDCTSNWPKVKRPTVVGSSSSSTCFLTANSASRPSMTQRTVSIRAAVQKRCYTRIPPGSLVRSWTHLRKERKVHTGGIAKVSEKQSSAVEGIEPDSSEIHGMLCHLTFRSIKFLPATTARSTIKTQRFSIIIARIRWLATTCLYWWALTETSSVHSDTIASQSLSTSLNAAL